MLGWRATKILILVLALKGSFWVRANIESLPHMGQPGVSGRGSLGSTP